MKFNKKRIKAVFLLMTFMLSMSFPINAYKNAYAEEAQTQDVNNISLTQDANNIIPKPLSYKAGKGSFKITKDTVFYIKGNNEEENAEISKIAAYFNNKLIKSAGFKLDIEEKNKSNKNVIYLTTVNGNENQGDEGYNLISNTESIKITAYKPQGLFRGIQTIIQMLPAHIEKSCIAENIDWSVPSATINDKPRYSYRSFMIDVARHFFSVDDIKRQIEHAAQYKINKLHIHLTDDQGWRIEIKKYPELTSIGASTEVGGTKGGYYTQEQFKDIVKYAQDRYVEIIPEFDMPGHTNAALASYGFLNPDGQRKPAYTDVQVGLSTFMTSDEKTYKFIDDVFKEVSEISPSKYIHIGGDEAYSTKKEDYDYFVGRVAKIAQKYGKTPIGWDPIDQSPSIDSNTVVQNWNESNENAVKKNMKIVLAMKNKAYLDMKYDENSQFGVTWAALIPIADAYNWDPTDYAPEEFILGIDPPLWTEFITAPSQMDYLLYPRLLGYAEMGWTSKELRNLDEYKIRLKNQKDRLTNEGINFYNDSTIFG